MATKVNDEQKPPIQLPAVEEVAQALVDIAAAVKKMEGTRLKHDAIVILLQAQCGSRVTRVQIRLVLQELGRMDRAWLKPLESVQKK